MKFIQPSIDPVLLSVGFLEIRWYSLAYIVGFLLGALLIKKLNNSIKGTLNDKDIDSFLIWAIIGVILGGRIGYVLFYQFEFFLKDPFFILEIWNGGMSFHGGLIGIIVSTYFFCKKNNHDFYYLSDLISISAPIGLFLGRIANFINSELIGRPTDFFIAVVYPSIDNTPRHPSQIYEAFLEGIILFIILMIYFNKYKKKTYLWKY